MHDPQKIIGVIKHGGLGDFIQAFDAFAAIRKTHPHNPITLITSQPLQGLSTLAPWFDHIFIDRRESTISLLKLPLHLIKTKYTRIYDLQTSARTRNYYKIARFLGFKGDWVGHVKGASHVHDNPLRDQMHTFERIKEQLSLTRINVIGDVDLGWLEKKPNITITQHIKKPFCVLVLACSPKRNDKRWPAQNFMALCQYLIQKDLCVLLVGQGYHDQQIAQNMIKNLNEKYLTKDHQCKNLVDQTSIGQLLWIFKQADLIIGNDTGLMHLAARTSTYNLTLFGQASNPQYCAPRGKNTHYIKADDLLSLTTDTVLDKINHLAILS
ncbi:MAG: glycosyltransferase family 9 protein [Pseudomonadota bacterium]